MAHKLNKDGNNYPIQGFEPSNVIAGSTSAIDLKPYMAFRVSGDVDLTYTFGGVEDTDTVSLPKGSITVCTNIDSITCDTAVTIEVM